MMESPVDTMTRLTREDAIRYARERTEREGRKYVARDDFGKFYVVPLYKVGQEERRFDTGYETVGVVVKESL
jgi:hypothetical protein